MSLRSTRLPSGVLLSSLLLSFTLLACGGRTIAPPPDAGDADAAPDAAPDDGAVDGAVDGGGDLDGGDAAVCPDEDGDGFGATPCADDCDDTEFGVNPGAAEVCNGGIDDDCNGLADADDSVCVPCAAGYTGVDGDCTDIDECGTSGFCGTGSTSCTNVPGTFECACAAGYATATATGALCENIDECAAASNPCGPGACTDSDGSYACTCPSGYELAAAPAITCVDIDECTAGTALCTAGPPAATCSNTVGDYLCVCPTGYEGLGRGAAGCTDIDECAGGLDDCESVVGICSNTPASFTCACPAGFTGTGHGAGSCLWDDPSLLSLSFGAGSTMSPAFSPGTTMYAVTLSPGDASATVTLTVAQPAGATITVDGSVVASGGSVTLPLGFATEVVSVVVTTVSGATRTYTIVVARSSTYIKASNTGATDDFGLVVSLSADGTRLAVGAPWEDSNATGIGGNQADNSALQSGAVYLFALSGTTWAQEAYIKASNAGAGDQFGTSVSLSADGTRLAVGAMFEASSATGIGGDQTDNSVANGGAAYVFSRTGTTWTQEAYVKASNTGGNDFFGVSVSLSADGTRLAVSAQFESSAATGVGGDQTDNSAAFSGAVYVFSRSGTNWTQEAYVKASNTNASDQFGAWVALSADGARLAVGAVFEASSATGIGGNQADNSVAQSGAAYVFSRTGTAWAQEAYLKASNTGAGDRFGRSVSLSADGSRLAVGAWQEDSSATGIGGNDADNSLADSGAAYVFSRTGTTWTQEAYIKASNTGATDYFGQSVSLSSDGTRLAVSAHWEDSNATGIGGGQADNSVANSGAAYVFSRVGTTWTQQAYVKASNTAAGDRFGQAVSLSADGSRLAVGALDEDSNATGIGGDQTNNSNLSAGAVYLY